MSKQLRISVRTTTVTLGLASVLAACDASAPATGGGGNGCEPACLVSSTRERETIAAFPAEAAPQVEGNTAFALKLYGALRTATPDADIFYSPYSISVALAMTHAGARAETAAQMKSTLELRLDGAPLHRAFNALDQELARRAQEPVGTMGGDPFRLTVANALWGRTGYSFQPDFLDVMAMNYGAGMRVLDFVGNPDGARLTINQWVEDKTAGKIKDLLAPGIITPSVVLVLTNAIYFKASWATVFNAATPRTFQLLDGSRVDVPTMRQTARLSYFETDVLQAVALPYAGDKMSMVVIAPKAGQWAAFEAGLSVDSLAAVSAGLGAADVILDFPKFNFTSQFSLKDSLSDLGMQIAFGPGADFSGINGTGGLEIEDVIHKAFVGVDEKGTEAAAATAVIIGERSVPPPPIPVAIDRPFFFLIRDEPTGAMLFVGRVLDPR